MINKRLRWFFCPCIFVAILASFESASPQPTSQWRVKNRLQVGYEFDDNIRESSSDSLAPIEDSSLRILFNARAVRISTKSSLAFAYRGGLQTYFDNKIENKLINEISSAAGFRVKSVVLGVRFSGRLKSYLNDVLDYATGSLEFYTELSSGTTWRHEIGISAGGIDYQNFPSFNYTENELKWLISKKISRRVSMSLELAGRQLRFDRAAVEFPTQSTTVLLDEDQKDHNYRAQVRFNFTKSFLFNVSYTIQKNSSNSAGYAFDKHQFTVIFGLPLWNGIWLRGYAATQLKRYAEDFAPMFPVEVDTEREDSNFFTLDLSKDISDTVSMLIRFASYSNESVIRNVFYNKNTVTLGFDLRF